MGMCSFITIQNNNFANFLNSIGDNTEPNRSGVMTTMEPLSLLGTPLGQVAQCSRCPHFRGSFVR